MRCVHLNQKAKSKIFFFFLIFSISLSIFAIPIKADTPIAKPTITADHLYIQPKSFVPNLSPSGAGQLHVTTGGEDLLSFINLGQISYDSINNQILYKAHIRLSSELTVHTTVDFEDADPDFSVSRYERVPYLWVDKFSWIGDPSRYTAKYYAGYYAVDFDIANTHEYNGVIPLEIGIKNTVGFGGEKIIGSYTFTMPSLDYDVMSVKVADRESGIIGGRDDILVDFNGVEEGRLTIVSVTEDTANQKVVDYVNNYANIGWKKGSTTPYITLQGEKLGGSQVGASLNDNNPADDVYIGNLDVLLRPRISEMRQYNTLTRASMWWDYHDMILPIYSPKGMGFYWGPSTMDAPRRVAVQIVNQYIHYNFIIEMDLYMTVQPDYILSESELATPFFEQGNWVWDTTFQGDVPTLVEDTVRGDDLINAIFGIIIIVIVIAVIGVIIYAFVQVGVPLLSITAKNQRR